MLIGIIRNDSESYLAVAPGWRPSLAGPGELFGMAELLQAIGA